MNYGKRLPPDLRFSRFPTSSVSLFSILMTLPNITDVAQRELILTMLSCLRSRRPQIELRHHRTKPKSPTTITVPIPHFAPAIDLPAALPTTGDTESSQEFLTDDPALKVAVVGTQFVVKHGKGLNLQEGRMMIFIRQKTTVPVPCVFALFEEDGRAFIMMERIYGRTLREVWDINDDHKKKTTSLKGFLQ